MAEAETTGTNPKAKTGSRNSPKALLALGALGVVFGDIGTSPLYTFSACFNEVSETNPQPEFIMGICSLIFWALALVITLKYVIFVMRVDYHGEGGTLALFSLLNPIRKKRKSGGFILIMSILGAALLFGDGMITPAISVLSAVGGLEVRYESFAPWSVPIAVALLVMLFVMQRFGTSSISLLFSPVMLAWFLALAAMGIWGIIGNPEILKAMNPAWAVDFLLKLEVEGFLVLGAVVLAVTGGEALFADMGHFGRWPIRFAWLGIVWPSLVINYLGQGAMLLNDPKVAPYVFFSLVPQWLLVPLVVLSTLAAVIASQAIITGLFSLTRQASQLGMLPRWKVVHTSAKHEGRIYMPFVNLCLAISCILLVLLFREPENLAAAYGVAVTMVMTITTILFGILMQRRWKAGWLLAAPVMIFFLIIDITFLSSNLVKLPHGGWVPIVVAICIYIAMLNWKQCRSILSLRVIRRSRTLKRFNSEYPREQLARIPGPGVYLTLSSGGVPPALVSTVRLSRAIHEQVILLRVIPRDVPEVPLGTHMRVWKISDGIWRAIVPFGYQQTLDLPLTMKAIGEKMQIDIDTEKIFYFRRRDVISPNGPSRIFKWRKKLFIIMSRNSNAVVDEVNIPPEQLFEVGTAIDL